MADENVIQQVTPTEPAQAPVSTPVVEILATEPTPAPIPSAEPIPAPVAEPILVVDPAPVTEPAAIEPVKPATEEPIEIEMPEPASAEATARQSQPEPQVVEKTPTQKSEQVVYKEDPGIIRRLLDKAKSKLQERKQKKLDKIMSLFAISPQISSKDVQKLLRTSKRTATRYLDQLEKEQKIIQHGKIGHGVLYTRRQ